MSSLLASMLNIDKIFSCIELSAGEGSLIEPLKKINSSLQFTTVDLDPDNCQKLTEKYPEDIHICNNALNLNLDIKDDSFDLAVCNPPFASITKTAEHEHILGNEFSSVFVKSKKIRLEILFILRNLNLLKKNASLAIIVPDLIFNSNRLAEFRTLLFKTYSLSKIIECEHKCFNKTEAKTFILFIKKIKPNNNCQNIPYYILKNSELFKSSLNLRNNFNVNKKTNSALFDIFRGATSSKLCRATKESFHHNYSYLEDFSKIKYPITNKKLDKFKYAIEGDILINRIGRNVGRTIFLDSSCVIVSDCIIVVRFYNLELKAKFIQAWMKEKDNWLVSNIKGTCAKNISIGDVNSYIMSLS